MRLRDATQNFGTLSLAAGDMAKLFLPVDPTADFETGTQDTGKISLEALLAFIELNADDAANALASQTTALTVSGDVTLTIASTTRMQNVDATFAGGATRTLTLPSANRKAMDVVTMNVTLVPAESGQLNVADTSGRVELSIESPQSGLFTSNHLVACSFMYDRTNDTWRLLGLHYQE